jgi:hypothetical protein
MVCVLFLVVVVVKPRCAERIAWDSAEKNGCIPAGQVPDLNFCADQIVFLCYKKKITTLLLPHRPRSQFIGGGKREIPPSQAPEARVGMEHG